MTSQAKNARRLAKARDITKLHKNGEKGPAKTTPLHGKRWTYRTNPEIAKRNAEAMKQSAEKQTVLDKINAKKSEQAKYSAVNED